MVDIDSLREYVLSALDVVSFNIVRSRDKIEDENMLFPPGMAHQIFGQKENIFGYKDLKIQIFYVAGEMHNYITMKYSSKVHDQKYAQADDVIDLIMSTYPPDCCCSNKDDFLKLVDKGEKFAPYGDKIGEHITDDPSGKIRYFELYYCDGTNSTFLDFFCRLETFVLWFVDAATYIDVDDPKWRYFVCYEKFKNSNGNYQYATVGYSTVYEFYSFPERIRPRISQMLILPPFQKLGLGTKLIESIYYHFSGKNVIDITVEDPSEEFQSIRNYIDANLCIKLKSFKKEVIKNGFNDEMVNEARKKFKINPKQCRIVYEILRLYYTDINDLEDYKNYRLAVKKRLNMPYFKQLNGKKLQSSQQNNDMDVDSKATLQPFPSEEERMKHLTEEYKTVEETYLRIIRKMKINL